MALPLTQPGVDSVLELAFFFLLKVPEKKKVVKKDQSVSSGKNQNYPDSTPGSKEDSLWTLETPQVGTNFLGFAGSCCLQPRTEAVALSELALGIQTRAAARAAHSFLGMRFGILLQPLVLVPPFPLSTGGLPVVTSVHYIIMTY